MQNITISLNQYKHYIESENALQKLVLLKVLKQNGMIEKYKAEKDKAWKEAFEIAKVD